METITRLFRDSILQRDAIGRDQRAFGRHLLTRKLDAEIFEGRLGAAQKKPGGATKLTMARRLQKFLGPSRSIGRRTLFRGSSETFDRRQRAIVKIHYFGHANGGAEADTA